MSETVQPAWRRKLEVVGQPVVVDGVALVLAQPQGDLHMVALDLSTGRELWRRSYNPTDFLSGTPLSPVLTKDRKGRDLVLLRRPTVGLDEGYSYTALEAVLPRTGKVVGENGRPGVFYACPDGRDVCLDGGYYFSGVPNDADGLGPVTGGEPPSRWDPLHARRDSRPLGGPDATFQVASPGLYATRLGAQRIVRVKDGKLLWSKKMTAAFGPRRTSDRGWSFEHFADSDVFAGSVGREFPQRLVDRYFRGRPVTYDLTDVHQVVGLDGATGERLWRIAGANPFCGLASSTSDGADLPLACIMQGRVVEQEERDIKRRDLVARLGAYDPATGELTWSIDLDRRTALRSVIDHLVVMAPGGVVVGTVEGVRAVDRSDGSMYEVPEDAVTWCSDGTEDIEAPMDRTGGTLFFACTPNGEPTKESVSEWGVAALPEVDGWRLVSTEGRVLGYRL